MKIRVVKDEAGAPVATFDPASNEESGLQPDLAEGHTVEDIDVPDDYPQTLDAVYGEGSK